MGADGVVEEAGGMTARVGMAEGVVGAEDDVAEDVVGAEVNVAEDVVGAEDDVVSADIAVVVTGGVVAYS